MGVGGSNSEEEKNSLGIDQINPGKYLLYMNSGLLGLQIQNPGRASNFNEFGKVSETNEGQTP